MLHSKLDDIFHSAETSAVVEVFLDETGTTGYYSHYFRDCQNCLAIGAVVVDIVVVAAAAAPFCSTCKGQIPSWRVPSPPIW